MAQCNVQTLLSNAAAFANLPPGMWDAIELQLLCEILNAGGGGGGGGGTPQILSTSNANPNTSGITPAAPGQGAIWYQDPAVQPLLNVWLWSVQNQVWVQFSV